MSAAAQPITTEQSPGAALDALFDAAVAAARAGHGPALTFYGNAQLSALRAWADRHGFPVTSDRHVGTVLRAAVQWDCDEVSLPGRGRITVHGDERP